MAADPKDTATLLGEARTLAAELARTGPWNKAQINMIGESLIRIGLDGRGFPRRSLQLDTAAVDAILSAVRLVPALAAALSYELQRDRDEIARLTRERDAEKARADAAEVDNAALREGLERIEAGDVAQVPGLRIGFYGHAAIEAKRVLAAPGPGAALAERLRKLEAAIPAILKAGDKHQHSLGCVVCNEQARIAREALEETT